jgi:uncharacterized membrane protein YuzA (DUF378 family)
MDSEYVQKKLYALAVLLVVIGGFNWGLVAFTGKDAVSTLFGKGSMVANGIFIAVALSALLLAFYRDSYLPFLGPTVMPCSLLKEQVPENADFEVRIYVKPGAKILYWASEPANKDLETVQDWKKAYLGFRNAGVAMADKDGYVNLKVRKPQSYTVPMRGELSPHIHYRQCGGNGFIGRVETVSLDGKEYFENVVASQEEKEPVEEESEFNYVKPSTALAEVNETAVSTAQNSLMPQDGAVDEHSMGAGADFDQAFASIKPIPTTMIQYS